MFIVKLVLHEHIGGLLVGGGGDEFCPPQDCSCPFPKIFKNNEITVGTKGHVLKQWFIAFYLPKISF